MVQVSNVLTPTPFLLLSPIFSRLQSLGTFLVVVGGALLMAYVGNEAATARRQIQTDITARSAQQDVVRSHRLLRRSITQFSLRIK